MMKMRLALLCGLLAFCTVPTVGMAQSYPTRTVHMIVPYAAGGASDTWGRLIAQKLSPMIKQAIVVENRTGASGDIGTSFVAQSAPDGYTILLANSNLSVLSAFGKAKYKPLQDFVPVGQVISSTNVIIVRPDLPINSLQELIAYAKANPGKLNFATSGMGTPMVIQAQLNSLAKIDLNAIPYKGDTPALADLMGGHVDLYATSISSVLDYIRSGKLRALAVTSKKRNPLLPDVPTVDESAFPGYEMVSWYGVVAPKKTDPEIVRMLSDRIREIVQMPDVQQHMTNLGMQPAPTTVEQFTSLYEQDVKNYADLVAKFNLKAD